MKRGEDMGAMMVARDALEVKTGKTFDQALADFVAYAQKVITDHNTRLFPSLAPSVLEIDPNGKRYVRIVRQDMWRDAATGEVSKGGGRSVHVFVDTMTGDVLKPAGWKGPAKHARGNIYGDLSKSVGPYGAGRIR